MQVELKEIKETLRQAQVEAENLRCSIDDVRGLIPLADRVLMFVQIAAFRLHD